MRVKLIIINVVIVASVQFNMNNIFAQDTIYVSGMGGQIIKNSNGTFCYFNNIQIVDDGATMTSFSYGRWKQLNDSIFMFRSSNSTKHEILKSNGLNDTQVDTNEIVVDVKNEAGDFLCKKDKQGTHFLGESSILGIVVDDSMIRIYGVSQYGQWNLQCKRLERTINHYVIHIRDAYYYNLDFLCLFLKKENIGYSILQ